MILLLAALLLGADPAAPPPKTPRASRWLEFPGKGPASMDYLAFDPARHQLWLPAGSRGQVFVLDTAANTFRTVEGFPTRTAGDRTRGPSSATVGEGVVYVGNRADSAVCTVDAATLKKRGCVTIPSMPDGVVYVPTTREVWVTTPESNNVTVLSVAKPDAPALAKTVSTDGQPEGYAVDPQAGVFYTNLEDMDRTLAFDVKSRKRIATYSPECGAGGPRGLALDAEHHRLFVACTDGARTLDLAHGGTVTGRLKTGGGVDNIDYDRGAHQLLVASGRDGALVLAAVDDGGGLTEVGTLATGAGARCVVAGDRGAAYVPDARGGRLMVVAPKQ